MTVCIAAMCEGIIFGAADRMRTAGDVQFETRAAQTQFAKIFPITSSIVVMTAGATTFQREILQDLSNAINARIQTAPTEWWKVKDVTQLYVYFYNQAKSKRAEAAILAPLGLTKDSFIARQAEMNDGFVQSIASQMLSYPVPQVSAIITGIDEEGAHIYVVHNNDFSCWDTMGFAAIGSGARHAESQFMAAQHSPFSPAPETSLLTYYAKKRSETAPGVGKETDMFLLGTHLGSYTPVHDSVKKQLEKLCNNIIKKEAKIHQDARKEVKRYLEEIKKSSIEKKQGDSDGAGASNHISSEEKTSEEKVD